MSHGTLVLAKKIRIVGVPLTSYFIPEFSRGSPPPAAQTPLGSPTARRRRAEPVESCNDRSKIVFRKWRKLIFRLHRWIIMRRLGFIVGMLYLGRSITMLVTALPPPDPNYPCEPKVLPPLRSAIIDSAITRVLLPHTHTHAITTVESFLSRAGKHNVGLCVRAAHHHHAARRWSYH